MVYYQPKIYDKYFLKPSNFEGFKQFYKIQNIDENQKKILEEIQKENFENTRIDWMDHAPYVKIRTTKVSELNDGTRQYDNYPEKIGKLKTLKKLILKGFEGGATGGIKKIPDTIFDLEKLEYLDLSCNRIKILPESIRQLKLLRHLDLSGNQIFDIPSSIGELTFLEKLNLGGNKINTLPTSIKQLENLQLLFLGSNRFTSIPKSIYNLINLQILDLSFNRRIKSLPSSIGNLELLQELYLSPIYLKELFE